MQPFLAQRRNHYSDTELRAELAREGFARFTLSFYRYVRIEDPAAYRDVLWDAFSKLGVRGRIYIAEEGINAQLSVPEHDRAALRDYLDSTEYFTGVPWKVGLLQTDDSFLKLIIKVKKQIVADGLPATDYDITDVGQHLTAEEWNRDMEDPETLVIDMRNSYESDVGRFENAVTPEVLTFREELPMVAEMVKGQEQRKIRLYCTGGIRCEKASAYLKSKGCTDVGQLHGGIIQYAHETKERGLPVKFHGKNFVFDERMGERVTDEVVGKCLTCGEPCDTHVNCANSDCSKLFLQCAACKESLGGCCSMRCQEYMKLSCEEQARVRQEYFGVGEVRFQRRMGKM